MIKSANKKSIFVILLAFILPISVLFAAYGAIGIYPFGEKSVLIMDMSDQYVQFYGALRDIVTGESNLLYSWKMGFGGNFFGIFAYYLSSPFTLITVFFDDKMLPIGVLIVNLIKIGLAGVTFSVFLRYIGEKTYSYKKVIFSTLYALTSYCVAYSMCQMWLDAVIWLPILTIGIEKLIKENKKSLFIAVMAIVFISNYYISYMIGIFLAIYFVYRMLLQDKFNLRYFIRKTIAFIISTVVSLGLSAWLVFPTLFSLTTGKIGGNNYVSNNAVNFEFLEIIPLFFTGNYKIIDLNGLPLVFCGLISLILFLLYFTVKGISKKEKILSASVIIFFILSFFVTKLDIMWHGFVSPNWFPYRNSFLLSFFIIYLAYKAFLNIKNISTCNIIIAGGIVLVVYISTIIMAQGVKIWLVFVIVALITTYATLLLIIRRKPNLKKAIIPIILVLCIGELFANSYLLISGLDKDFGYEKTSEYIGFKDKIRPLIDTAQRDESLFYRIDKTFEYSKNDALGEGYNGMTHYSSSYDSSTNNFLENLGFGQDYIWCSYYGSTALTDSLFAVKYIMSEKEVYRSYPKIAEKNETFLYQNPNVLPLGYMVSEKLLQSPFLSEEPFSNQNIMLSGMLDKYTDCFKEIKSEIELFNIDFKENEGYTRFTSNGDEWETIEFTFTAPDSNPIYANFPFYGNKRKCMLYVNNVPLEMAFTSESVKNFYLGSFEKGDKITVSLDPQEREFLMKDCQFYSLDDNLMRKSLEELRANSLELTEFSDSYLKGDIEVTDKQLLFTSIRADDGWVAFVDGKQVPIVKYQDTLACVNLSKGKHTVEFKFYPKGFKAGVGISIATLILIIVYIFTKKCRDGKVSAR